MRDLDKARKARWAHHPLSRFGDGPWRILPGCPAERGHNTMRAARGRFDGYTTSPNKCLCPRALALLAAYHEIERKRKRGELPRKEPKVVTAAPAAKAPGDKLPIYMTNVKRHSTAEIPDLSAAACRTRLDAIWLMDRAIDGVNGALERARDELCFRCPVREACLEMALAHEEPAGAWGGLYGGASPGERKVMKRAREARNGLVAA